jgi:hypothetical protein
LDEIDDAVGALRQWWLRVQPEMESVLLACWGVAVFALATLMSPGALSVAAIAIAGSVAIAEAMRRGFERYNAP